MMTQLTLEIDPRLEFPTEYGYVSARNWLKKEKERIESALVQRIADQVLTRVEARIKDLESLLQEDDPIINLTQAEKIFRRNRKYLTTLCMDGKVEGAHKDKKNSPWRFRRSAMEEAILNHFGGR